MKTSLLKLGMLAMVLTTLTSNELCAQAAPAKAPELVFMNPVLVGGKDKQEGATYRFAKVTSGVDAEIKFKKFSSKSIVVNSVDNNSLGWSKAFQPEFGYTGVVQPNQNWYIDFELNFYEAGGSKKLKMSAVDMTALDVDGDGVSIAEYVIMNSPFSVSYSSVSYLLGNLGQVGGVGQTFTCPDDNIASPLMLCTQCLGTGLLLGWQCDLCEGSGKLYSACRDPYHTGTVVQGPVENFTNIDTLATQVMATYNYKNVDKITFRYGAKSGKTAVNGSGVRLNSLWFRQFSLAPASSLPVKLSNFNAAFDSKDVTLSWTGYEENFSHYIIQRSQDGVNYDDLALVFTGNELSGVGNYKFKDKGVGSPTGNIFYRLKMVDVTKEMSYSQIRIIHLNADRESMALGLYPNPVAGQLKVTLPAAWQGKPVEIGIFSQSGAVMSATKIGSASQTELMNTNQLPRGSYVIKATCNGAVAQQLVLKQ